MCQLTDHSRDRMKERCGANKSSMDKIAKTALDQGIRHEDTAGSLHRYLDHLYLQRNRANNLRIYGDKVYLFYDDSLITVLQLPQKYMKTCNQLRKKAEG